MVLLFLQERKLGTSLNDSAQIVLNSCPRCLAKVGDAPLWKHPDFLHCFTMRDSENELLTKLTLNLFMTHSAEKVRDYIQQTLDVRVEASDSSSPKKTPEERYAEKLARDRNYRKTAYKKVTKRVQISLSLDEYAQLQRQANNEGTKPSTLARTLLLESMGKSAHIPPNVAEELRQLQRDLTGALTNINQMAFRVNCDGAHRFDETYLKRQVQSLDSDIKKTLRTLYQDSRP